MEGALSSVEAVLPHREGACNMAQASLAHPNRELLSAFGLGRLGEAESVEIESHLAGCDTCRAVLEFLPPDTLVSMLQASSPTVPPHETQPATGGSQPSPPLATPVVASPAAAVPV